jgi:transcription initiation factor TFIIB
MSKKREMLVGEDVCPECGSTNLILDEDSGEVVCGRCGLVVSDSIIDMGPEWRAFTPEERDSRSRVGLPLSYSFHDKGISTMISQVTRDAHGATIPPEARIEMIRLRTLQTRSRVHESVDRNLAQAMAELDRLSHKLHIPPSVKEEAAVVYRRALEKDLVRGRAISSIMAASLYAACRITRTPRTLREIARYSLYDWKEVSRCYRTLIKDLGLRMPVPEPQLRVPKIAAKAGIGERTQRTAVEILRKAGRVKETAGKDPMGLAAAALYIACLMNDEKQTQKTIGDAAGVTEVTIRNRYKSLKEALKLNIRDTR